MRRRRSKVLNPTMFGLRLKRSGGGGVMNMFGTCIRSSVFIYPLFFNEFDVFPFKISFSEKISLSFHEWVDEEEKC